MSQLTRQDVAEVVEEVVDRVLDRKLDEKMDPKLDQRFTEFEGKLDQKLDERFTEFEEKLDHKLDRRFVEFEEKLDHKLDKKLDKKLDEKLGTFVEHLDDKFDGLAEAISLMNTTIGTLAKASELEEVQQDVKTVKIAVRATNDDLRHLDGRFDGLEAQFDQWEERFGGSEGDSTDWKLDLIR